VVRGGCFDFGIPALRSSGRGNNYPGYHHAGYGARCARNLPAEGDADGDGTPDALDCAPADPNVHPGAVESCNRKDDDCDGSTDEDLGSTICGLGACAHATPNCVDGVAVTCDPMAGATTETCNGRDDDCDGSTDEETTGAACSTGKLGVCAVGTTACAAGTPSCTQATSATVEVCDGKDNDCNGVTDEANAADCMNYLLDSDGDGYGVTGNAKCLCAAKAPYSALQGGDCLDSDKDVRPGKAEICNGKDDNCDGATDPENTTGCAKYYEDADGDGYGATAKYKCLCAGSGFYTTKLGGDCDEMNTAANPGKPEDCATAFDDNCDGKTQDQVAGAVGCKAFFYDADNDGFGTADNQCWCVANGLYRAPVSGDCGDANAAVHPGGKVCGIDGNCDGNPFDTGESCDDGNSDPTDGCDACVLREFMVGTNTKYDSNLAEGVYRQSLAVFPDDRFVVVWTGLDSGDYNVYGRRFGADAAALAGPFRVNSVTDNGQSSPVVATFPDGRFVVAYGSEAAAQDSDGGVCARRYGADGSAEGPEIVVNTWKSKVQSTATIGASADGRYLIAWMSYGQEGAVTGIYAQRFLSNGTPAGSEFRVNTTIANEHQAPVAAALSSGGYVVAWTATDTQGKSIFARRFAADGTTVGSEFRVNTTIDGYRRRSPAIAALTNDRFVVTWTSEDSNGIWEDVYGQRFKATGAKDGGEFMINPLVSRSQFSTSVAAFADDRFVVAWMDDTNRDCGTGFCYFDVYARRFNADGTAQDSNDFRIHTLLSNNQGSPTAATFSNGRFGFVWEGMSPNGGSPTLVWMRRFNADGTPMYR
jgi:hypothetical protein